MPDVVTEQPAEKVIAALTAPEAWLDYASEIGRFTVAGAYKMAGRDAQDAFWGQDNHVAQSMLHQLALQIA